MRLARSWRKKRGSRVVKIDRRVLEQNIVDKVVVTEHTVDLKDDRAVPIHVLLSQSKLCMFFALFTNLYL